jgi:predicted  nucleic acid-binding Zn-ribbon protein
MADLDRRCEKCERDIEQLRREVAEVMALIKGVLAHNREVLAKVEVCNRQMFADLRAQTDAGFASLRACIDAAYRTERKDDEPPKLN